MPKDRDRIARLPHPELLARQERRDPVEAPKRPFGHAEPFEQREHIDGRDRRKRRGNEGADDLASRGGLDKVAQPRVGEIGVGHGRNMPVCRYLSNGPSA